MLLFHNGKPIAVVEAKKTAKSAALGRNKPFSMLKTWKDHGGTFRLWCNDGYDIYFWESDFLSSRKGIRISTRNDFGMVDKRRESANPFCGMINTDIAGRDYQIAAVRSILEGVEQKRINSSGYGQPER